MLIIISFSTKKKVSKKIGVVLQSSPKVRKDYLVNLKKEILEIQKEKVNQVPQRELQKEKLILVPQRELQKDRLILGQLKESQRDRLILETPRKVQLEKLILGQLKESQTQIQ
jgi:hypothetical protein